MTKKPGNATRAPEAGVTLIELLVVLVVITIGILALTASQTRTSVDVYATGRNTRALELAQARLETTRADGFEIAASDSGQGDGFNWRVLVDSVSVDLKTVAVTVSWVENGQAESLRLDDLLSDR